MKGFIEEIQWTAIVWIFFGFILLIAFVHYIINGGLLGTEGTIAYSIELTDNINRPNTIAESLSHYKIDDRQLLEHCTQAVATNNLEGHDIEDPLKEFLDKYDRKYRIELVGSNTLLDIGDKKAIYKTEIPLIYKDIVGYLVVNII